MKQLLVFFTVLAVVITGLPAQEPAGNDTGKNQITAISVSGLKKTKPRIIERPLQVFIGKDAGTIDTNEVYAVVEGTGVLELVSVELIDNQEGSGNTGGKTLAVTVKDKWSIFPIPIGSISSSGWGLGAVLMDTNAFGLKDTAMLVGMYSPGDWMASVMYIATPDGIGDFGWNVTGMFSLRENESQDQTGKEILRRYNSMSINPGAGLSYQLSEFITPAFDLSYKYVALRDSDDPVNAPEKGVHGITFSPSVTLQLPSTWDGYFLNEKKASVKYEYTLVVDDTDVHSASLNAAFNHSIIPGFRVIANSGIVFATPSAAPFFSSTSTASGVNILPQKYSAVNFAGLSAGLEKSLLKFKFGALSLSASYQIVYSGGDLLASQFDHGPAAMLQLYLSRVAIPGIGFGAAYNVPKNTWQIAASMGVSF
jgi:hypothetical protein